ncbi:MAG TPA: hypothetical protein VEY70_06965 [Metabacillus sp.]|nr:hypothetical protein [Metabacillus sp.]
MKIDIRPAIKEDAEDLSGLTRRKIWKMYEKSVIIRFQKECYRFIK